MTTDHNTLLLIIFLVVLSVDSVDYTKGLNYRLNAFERFLEKYPSNQGNVVLVLIVQAAGGREYQQLKETLDNMVYQINMRFSTDTWTPVHYIQRPVYEEELAGTFHDMIIQYNIKDAIHYPIHYLNT